MKNQTRQRKYKSCPKERSQRPNRLPKALAVFLVLAVATLIVRLALAQSIPQPVLAITSVASNQITITITNGVSYGTYDLYTTPVLGNDAAYPWTAAMIGTNSQTNFIINLGPYPAGFYRVVVDTNSIPIWEAADPNNPGAGILTVFIDSPANGSNLTQ
jgi:hypothetical protein